MKQLCADLLNGVKDHPVADAYSLYADRTTVSYKANRLESIKNTLVNGSGLRVLVDDQLGYAGATTDIAPKQIVEDALELAQFGPVLPNFEFTAPPKQITELPRYFAPTAQLDVATLSSHCDEAIDQILSVRDDVNVDVTVSKSSATSYHANQKGLAYESKSSLYSLGLSIKRSTNDEILYCTAGATVRDHTIDRAHYRSLCQQALEQLARCDTAAKLETGDYPVIFTGKAIYGFLYPLLIALNGGNLSKGTSPLAEDRYSKIFPKSFILQSNPRIDGSLANKALDGDGLPQDIVDLISDGQVQNGIFDLVTAAKWRKLFPKQAQWAKAGCARRLGFGGSTSPSYATLTLQPGTDDNLIKNIKKGILVENLLGVRMGNPLSGEFSNNVSIGHLIEDGQVVGRVKNVMVSGNIYEALNTLEGLSSHAEWINDHILLPDIHIGRLRVTCKI